MKILVVDDDLSNLTLIKTVLENNDYEVVLAANGEKALEILRSEKIDLIISDILMPVMDGYHLCQECKADKKLQNIPFIFCSGTYTEEKDEILSIKFGAEAFIVKPFQNKVLLETISRVLKNIRNGKINMPAPSENDSTGAYKLYSERLINKLEEKMLDLDKEKMVLEMEVAERRKVEERLRKSRNFAESLFNAAPGIVLILDPEGRIIRFNPYMEKVSGYLLKDVMGRYWVDVFSPEDGTQNFSTDALPGSSEEIPTGNVSTIVTKTGEKKKIMWFDSTLKDENGQVIGLLAVGQDITRQIEQQKETLEIRAQIAAREIFNDFAKKLDKITNVLFDQISFLEAGSSASQTDKQIKELKKAAGHAKELSGRLKIKNTPGKE